MKRKFFRTPKKNQSTSAPILSRLDKTSQYDKLGTDDTLGKPAITTSDSHVITLKSEVRPELTQLNLCPKDGVLYKKNTLEKPSTTTMDPKKKVYNSDLLKLCMSAWQKPYRKSYKLNYDTNERLIAETAIMTWVGPETKPSDAVQSVYKKFFKKGYKNGYKLAYHKACSMAFMKAHDDSSCPADEESGPEEASIPTETSGPTDAPGTKEDSGMTSETETSNDERRKYILRALSLEPSNDKDAYKRAYNDPLNIKCLDTLVKNTSWRYKNWWDPKTTKLSNIEGLSDDDVYAKFIMVGYKNGFKQAYDKAYNEAYKKAHEAIANREKAKKEKAYKAIANEEKANKEKAYKKASGPKENSSPSDASDPKTESVLLRILRRNDKNLGFFCSSSGTTDASGPTDASGLKIASGTTDASGPKNSSGPKDSRYVIAFKFKSLL